MSASFLAAAALSCAGVLQFTAAGHVSSVTKIEQGVPWAFPKEVPNNGFILAPRPDLWDLGFSFRDESDMGLKNGGMVWIKMEGAPLFHKWQPIRVTITIGECPERDAVSIIKGWGGMLPEK